MLDSSLKAFTPEHRKWTRIASVVGFITVVGLCIAFFFATQYGGAWDKGSVGIFLVTLVLFVGGNYFVFQVIDTIAHKGGRVARRLGFVALGVACVAAWGGSVVMATDMSLNWSLRSRASAEELTAFLGAGPGEVKVWMPRYPRELRPSDEEIERLGAEPIRVSDDSYAYMGEAWHYEVNGVHVFVDVTETDRGDVVWGWPMVELEESLTREELQELWGPAREGPASGGWWHDDIRAETQFFGTDKGDSLMLVFQRHRPVSALVGEGPEQPLADYPGRLVGKTPEELGTPLTRGSWSESMGGGGVIELGGPFGHRDLSVELDGQGRIAGWQLTILCFESFAECEAMEKTMKRFGPATVVPSPSYLTDTTIMRSDARPDLVWYLGDDSFTIRTDERED